MLNVRCPNCQNTLKVSDELFGSTGTCNKCGGRLTIDPTTVIPLPPPPLPPAPALVFIALDFETTGLDALKDGIVQIAAVRFHQDGTILDSFDTLVNPQRPIPREVSKLHGITTAKVRNAPTIAHALKSFLDWAGEFDAFVAHNAPFEADFLVQSMHQSGFALPQCFILDTCTMAQEADLNVSNFQLTTLAQHFAIGHVDAHDARQDAKATALLFLHLAKPSGIPAVYRRYKETLSAAALRKNAPAPWENEPATDAQLNYLRKLGAPEPALRNLSKGAASQLIDHLKAGGTIQQAPPQQNTRPIVPGDPLGCLKLGCWIFFAIVLFGFVVSLMR